MKRLLLILLLIAPALCFAQNVPVKTDTVSVWVGSSQYPLNMLTPVWNDVDSSVAFARPSGAIAEVSRKYYNYTLGGTPFASMAALKAWVKSSFFVVYGLL